MTSSYTTNKKIETPGNGDYVDNWNLPNNANFGTLDTAFGGYQILNPTGQSGVVTLTSSTSSIQPYTTTAQWQPPNLIIGTSLTASATLTANVNYQLPSGIGGVWSIYNNTTGGYSITFSSAGGGYSVVIPQGYTMQVICDGTNVRQANNTAVTLGATYIRLLGSTSGYVGFQASATSGNVTWTLPAADGTGGQFLATNGSGVLSFSNSLSGSSTTLASTITNIAEPGTISATAATGTIAFYVASQSILYYTSNASANWTVNLTLSAGTTLNTAMTNFQIVTVVFMVTQGSTAYYNTAVQVDGNSVTPKWQGGTAPSSGNASSIDAYTYTIIKTGSAAFTVLASQTKFA